MPGKILSKNLLVYLVDEVEILLPRGWRQIFPEQYIVWLLQAQLLLLSDGEHNHRQ